MQHQNSDTVHASPAPRKPSSADVLRAIPWMAAMIHKQGMELAELKEAVHKILRNISHITAVVEQTTAPSPAPSPQPPASVYELLYPRPTAVILKLYKSFSLFCLSTLHRIPPQIGTRLQHALSARRKGFAVLPENLQGRLIEWTHTTSATGHPGIQRTQHQAV